MLIAVKAAKRYIPDWPGMTKFKGVIHHSSFWPDEKIDVRGKKCAVIGTGASGVQIVQAWGPEAGELKVFQRTPNLAVPMRRRDLTVEEQEKAKKHYPELFRYREANFAGFLYDWDEKNTFDVGPEEREEFYERIWKDGGFRYWVALYKDNFYNPESNKESYKFWAKKTRARINDARKRDLLAPLDMPHYFGIKRPCLEYNYYEQFNRPSVDVVDIKNNAIKDIDETGILLEDGTHYDFDVIAVATGFVSHDDRHRPISGNAVLTICTGYCHWRYAYHLKLNLPLFSNYWCKLLTHCPVMTQLGLESVSNTKLEEEWVTGAVTYLGLTVSGYPNMFHIYGPQAPTLLSNGPTTVELQGRWIADCIQKMRMNNIKYINPKREAAVAWKNDIVNINNQMLFPTVRSTYMGGSIPGKVYEPVCYPGGIPKYAKLIRNALDEMTGFDIVSN